MPYGLKVLAFRLALIIVSVVVAGGIGGLAALLCGLLRLAMTDNQRIAVLVIFSLFGLIMGAVSAITFKPRPP